VIYGEEAWTLTNNMAKILRKKLMAQHIRMETGELKLILN
jgi:hypothetical protein